MFLEVKVSDPLFMMYTQAQKQLDHGMMNNGWKTVFVIIAFFVTSNYWPLFVVYYVFVLVPHKFANRT